jgi:hypothetical protein
MDAFVIFVGKNVDFSWLILKALVLDISLVLLVLELVLSLKGLNKRFEGIVFVNVQILVFFSRRVLRFTCWVVGL